MPATTPQLSEAKRQAAIDHVLTAARQYVCANGIDVTMDQLAEAAGVSRRTLFRMFGTRERLVATAYQIEVERYLHALPAFDGDTDAWLRATCDTAHRMHTSVGPGHFDLVARSDLPPELAALRRATRLAWQSRIADITATLWRAHGHDSPAPDVLLATVGAHLNAHFTEAVFTAVNRDWHTASALAYTAILSTMHLLAAGGNPI
ncbi:TetR/AcrR family transcriptional regulator [Nocardia bovistercoris]|uniref:TetR/AcrR family transcriptional regulator n=1 Tax=Nocardia bovistercoris TaxID=2785916 RepID=A0A931I615_9NOCA|nr:TetR/AcrR family transcriptional regulator [Nocardia bovistercoris]MBH0775527.1 TetR/AcrR family transcriptional regulator [Nocardia bovistercoris]